jgi:hypothetical protein
VPIWYYAVNPLVAAIITIVFVETLSLVGLFLARRFLLPRFNYSEGINDAVSGTVQAIGVFYGITVGLIAVGVWNTNSNAADLVSKEASAIGGMYRDVAGLPAPLNRELCDRLREYTEFVVNQEWPAQRQGKLIDGGTRLINDFQFKLFAFEPATTGQSNLHSEALRAFNSLTDSRRRRLDAVTSGLSGTMWGVIWVGAVFSIGVAYLFNIQDAKMHALLVGLMGGFLAIVLFMIAINDRPFYGKTSVTTDSYQLLLDRLRTGPVLKSTQ